MPTTTQFAQKSAVWVYACIVRPYYACSYTVAYSTQSEDYIISGHQNHTFLRYLLIEGINQNSSPSFAYIEGEDDTLIKIIAEVLP